LKLKNVGDLLADGGVVYDPPPGTTGWTLASLQMRIPPAPGGTTTMVLRPEVSTVVPPVVPYVDAIAPETALKVPGLYLAIEESTPPTPGPATPFYGYFTRLADPRRVRAESYGQVSPSPAFATFDYGVLFVRFPHIDDGKLVLIETVPGPTGIVVSRTAEVDLGSPPLSRPVEHEVFF
jgi:hypothetical protein